MPHFLSNMSDGSAKTSAKGRKTITERKRSGRQHRGTAALHKFCCSPGRATPPESDTNQQIGMQIQNSSWPTNAEVNLHFVGRCSPEFQDGISGQSPPKSDALRPTTGSQHAPAPASLPRPPSSWTMEDDHEQTTLVFSHSNTSGSSATNQLKMLLKMQGLIQ